MSILSSESAKRYYNEIEEVTHKQHFKPKDKLRDLRTVSDAIFKEITRNSRKFLTCTGSRSAYVFDTYNIEKDLRDELNGFRELANGATHELAADITEEDYLAGIKALSSAIKRFANHEIPHYLYAKYAHRDDLSLKKYLKQSKLEIIDFLALSIRKITPAKPGYPNKKATIEGLADGIGEVQVQLWDDSKEGASPAVKFASLAEQLWPYCRLHIFNLNYNREGDFYSTSHKTLLVVQPDYLIDASELAECFDNDGNNASTTLFAAFFM